MSQIFIESTKAARERLKMMRAPAELLLPFDTARIAPFGIRVFDGDQGKHQTRLTYQGRDIGVVEPHAENGFAVNLVFTANQDIEVAIRRIFRVVERHLDQNARFEAEEKRQAQLRENNAEGRAARRAAVEAERERKAAEEARRIAAQQAADLAACCGFAGDDHGPVLLPIDRDIVKHACAFQSDEDGLCVYHHMLDADALRRFFVTTAAHKMWHFTQQMEGGYALDRDGDGWPPDVDRVTTEILRIAARNRRLSDPDTLRAALANIAPRPFSMDRFRLLDLELESHEHMRLEAAGAEMSFKVSHNSITLQIENTDVVTWSVYPQNAYIDHSVSVISYDPLEDRALGREAYDSPEILAALSSIWVEAQVRLRVLDPELCRPFDVEEIADSARTLDLGYDL